MPREEILTQVQKELDSRVSLHDQIEFLLDYFRIEGPPVPLNRIVSDLGIRVIDVPFKDDISGALLRTPSESVIAVNVSQHLHRQRFTVAHELGHLFMNHSAGSEDWHVDQGFTVLRRDGESSKATNEQEIRANRFAAELLMPVKFLLNDLNDTDDIDRDRRIKLARKYQVSEIALSYRLGNLGLLPPI